MTFLSLPPQSHFYVTFHISLLLSPHRHTHTRFQRLPRINSDT